MRKIISKLLIVGCLCAYLIPATSAFLVQTYASSYFRSYSATTSSAAGNFVVSYNVKTTDSMSQVGVLKISVYTSSGSLVETITGSSANGLLTTNARNCVGTYTISGLTSGLSYYAVVEIYAADGNGSDSRTISTNTVKI